MMKDINAVANALCEVRHGVTLDKLKDGPNLSPMPTTIDDLVWAEIELKAQRCIEDAAEFLAMLNVLDMPDRKEVK